MTKYTEINGVQFETIKSKYTQGMINAHRRYIGRTLADCYNKPSSAKRGIYEDWREWYINADFAQGFGITSYNTFSFTIGAVLIGENLAGMPIGYMQITPSHNRLYLL